MQTIVAAMASRARVKSTTRSSRRSKIGRRKPRNGD
jgi:hypothetical protein